MPDATPFHDLDQFVRLGRVTSLTASADGSQVVIGVATPDAKGTRYVTSLWQLDPDGSGPARRLTRGLRGEAQATFHERGLLFTASRPGVDSADDDEAAGDGPAPLWLLPAEGGEARVVARHPGGITGLDVAADTGTVLLACDVLPAAERGDDSAARKARKDAGVDAILHEGYPIRYWDHDLGPGRSRLFTLTIPEDQLPAEKPALPQLVLSDVQLAEHDDNGWRLTPDGRTIVVATTRPAARARQEYRVETIDVATGERRTLIGDAEHEYSLCDLDAEGCNALVHRWTVSTPNRAPVSDLLIVPLRGGDPVLLTTDLDRQPEEARFITDGEQVGFVADDHGHRPIFVVDRDGTGLRRVTGDGAYTSLHPGPAGTVYALRSSYLAPNVPVRVDCAHGAVTELASPVPTPSLPGTLRELRTTAADGTTVRAWLALPQNASEQNPAPLLLWIHGGPVASWTAWSWRWCPWLMVAAGYAVLMPDPALSTGYGDAFVQRGWGRWGAEPFTDLMAITDAAEALPEIDESRTAAMGGSFGGYMANWIAGHTDRFSAIVSHAGLWNLEGFGPSTDLAFYWSEEMSPAMTSENSPHRFVDRIETPMLVIHGDKDYRVPIGEGLQLWFQLLAHSTDSEGRSPHKFLYYPQENHWILTPGNATVWYQTVLAFLAQHVLGQEWRRPKLLG